MIILMRHATRTGSGQNGHELFAGASRHLTQLWRPHRARRACADSAPRRTRHTRATPILRQHPRYGLVGQEKRRNQAKANGRRFTAAPGFARFPRVAWPLFSGTVTSLTLRVAIPSHTSTLTRRSCQPRDHELSSCPRHRPIPETTRCAISLGRVSFESLGLHPLHRKKSQHFT